jgi:hypothetical protein
MRETREPVGANRGAWLSDRYCPRPLHRCAREHGRIGRLRSPRGLPPECREGRPCNPAPHKRPAGTIHDAWPSARCCLGPHRTSVRARRRIARLPAPPGSLPTRQSERVCNGAAQEGGMPQRPIRGSNAPCEAADCRVAEQPSARSLQPARWCRAKTHLTWNQHRPPQLLGRQPKPETASPPKEQIENQAANAELGKAAAQTQQHLSTNLAKARERVAFYLGAVRLGCGMASADRR